MQYTDVNKKLGDAHVFLAQLYSDLNVLFMASRIKIDGKFTYFGTNLLKQLYYNTIQYNTIKFISTFVHVNNYYNTLNV